MVYNVDDHTASQSRGINVSLHPWQGGRGAWTGRGRGGQSRNLPIRACRVPGQPSIYLVAHCTSLSLGSHYFQAPHGSGPCTQAHRHLLEREREGRTPKERERTTQTHTRAERERERESQIGEACLTGAVTGARPASIPVHPRARPPTP